MAANIFRFIFFHGVRLFSLLVLACHGGHLGRLGSNREHNATVGLAVDHKVRLDSAVAGCGKLKEVPEIVCMANARVPSAK